MLKAIGVVRKLDNLGRVVLPNELRKRLDIKYRDSLDILIDGDKIILAKSVPKCVFCGDSRNVLFFRDKYICSKCHLDLKK